MNFYSKHKIILGVFFSGLLGVLLGVLLAVVVGVLLVLVVLLGELGNPNVRCTLCILCGTDFAPPCGTALRFIKIQVSFHYCMCPVWQSFAPLCVILKSSFSSIVQSMWYPHLSFVFV